MQTRIHNPSPAPSAPDDRPARRWYPTTRRGWLAVLGAVVVLAGAITALIFATLDDPLDSAPVAGVTDVVLRDDAFTPPVIAVEPGTTVTWRWDDGDEAHNIIGEGWGDDVPRATGTFSHTFDQPGSYVYQCTLHFRMTGRVDIAATTS